MFFVDPKVDGSSHKMKLCFWLLRTRNMCSKGWKRSNVIIQRTLKSHVNAMLKRVHDEYLHIKRMICIFTFWYQLRVSCIKFLIIWVPYSVETDSGWNWTPHKGNDVCWNPMTVTRSDLLTELLGGCCKKWWLSNESSSTLSATYSAFFSAWTSASSSSQ